MRKDTEKFEVEVSHDVHEMDRMPSYLKKTKWDKILKGHIATMFVLLFVFTDVVAVFGAIMVDSVCYAYDPLSKDSSGATIENPEWRDHIDKVDESLDAVSMAMLVSLLFYQIILCVAIGFWDYIKDYNSVLDFFIILISIIADLCIPDDGVALIAIALFWRCIRVFHGLYCEIEEFSEAADEDKEEISRLMQILKTNKITVPPRPPPKNKR
jgi:hypothetical protein